LVLPILVTPRENQPPVFGGAVIDFEPGQEKVIDLVRLTQYPFDDVDELAFTDLDPAPVGFTYTIAGQELRIRANESAAKGAVTSLSLGVRDDLNEGTPGRIELRVVPSTRPLASPLPDVATVRRGESTVIDVLANDQATNPFAGQGLTVVDIRGIEGSELPDGVTIIPSADSRTITATVAASAETADITIQYQVADATNDPDRYVWGTARVSIQDRPDSVSNIRVIDFADRRLTVAWNSAPFNNSPISGYTVVLASAASGEVLSSTECSGASCTVVTAGNGEQNAVRITVTARNSIGVSDPTRLAGSVWSDVVPAAPVGVTSFPRDGGLRIQWAKPADSGGGTPITSYLITIGGSTTQVAKAASDAAGTTYSYNATGLTNGTPVNFSVSARNESVALIANWNSVGATGYPAGAPLRVAVPTALATNDDGRSATLSWAGAFSANGRAITQYYAAVYTGAQPSCSVAVGESGFLPGTVVVPAESATMKHVDTGTSVEFDGLNANTAYSFVVFAFNGMGCTDSAVATATPRERPGTVSSFDSTAPRADLPEQTWNVKLTGFTASGEADSFRYRWVGAGIDPTPSGVVPLNSFITSADGQHYGRALSVEIQACKKYDGTFLCSTNWSPPQVVDVAVNNSDLVDLKFVLIDPVLTGVETAEYRWQSSPSGAYDRVTFSCDSGTTETVVSSEGPNVCLASSDAVAGTYSPLAVTITVGDNLYVRTYNSLDFSGKGS
jgi:hypothetical protein